MQTNLADKLNLLAHSLTEAERAHYKLLLGLATGGLAPTGQPPLAGSQDVAFRTVVNCLAHLQPYSDRIRPNGIAWRGCPSFITPKILRQLEYEASRLRPLARRFDRHYLAYGEEEAKAIASSKDLHELVTEYAGPVVSTGRANYIFYDKEGLGIDPHIDNEEFALNTILMVKHDYSSEPSHLVVYPPNSQPERILLQPGELVIFFADSVVHAREPTKRDESVTIVAFGFQPVTDSNIVTA